jgi:hypothetical protein
MHCFTCCAVWVWNLVSRLKRTQTEGDREKAAEGGEDCIMRSFIIRNLY